VIRSLTVAYTGPFFVFLALLALSKVVPLPALAIQTGFVAIMAAIIAIVTRPPPDGRPAFDFRVRHWVSTPLIGLAVFAIWVAPDRLFPAYRHFWLFENPLTGRLQTGLSAEAREQTAVLWLRAIRAVAIVPVVEELFWRGWLMRWLISPRFELIPLGTWSASAFWIVALLFASEHGPYWDVGLAAGVVYNWWMIRTRSLGDLVAAHAVTNACLSLYVVWTGQWEYWL
jgi:CAAX prenyl protease-like protein